MRGVPAIGLLLLAGAGVVYLAVARPLGDAPSRASAPAVAPPAGPPSPPPPPAPPPSAPSTPRPPPAPTPPPKPAAEKAPPPSPLAPKPPSAAVVDAVVGVMSLRGAFDSKDAARIEAARERLRRLAGRDKPTTKALHEIWRREKDPRVAGEIWQALQEPIRPE